MLEYRKATLEESDILAQIRVEFLCEANNVNDDDEKELLYRSNKRFISESLLNGSFVSWIALENEEIIATSGVSFYILPPNKKCPSGKVAYISNMYTYPKYRNQGIATKLFALIVDEAIKARCDKITLNATDMGKPIYEKFGFIDIRNDMVYYTQ